MFFLPNGLSNEETEIIFKNYNKFLKTAQERENERKLKVEEEKRKEVAAQKRKEKIDEMVNNIQNTLTTIYIYSYVIVFKMFNIIYVLF